MNPIMKELDSTKEYYADFCKWVGDTKHKFRSVSYLFLDARKCDFNVKDTVLSVGFRYGASYLIDRAVFSNKTASPFFLIAYYLCSTIENKSVCYFRQFMEKYRHYISEEEWKYFYCLFGMNRKSITGYNMMLGILAKYKDVYDIDSRLLDKENIWYIKNDGQNFTTTGTEVVFDYGWKIVPSDLIIDYCVNGLLKLNEQKTHDIHITIYPARLKDKEVKSFVVDYCVKEIKNEKCYMNLFSSFLDRIFSFGGVDIHLDVLDEILASVNEDKYWERMHTHVFVRYPDISVVINKAYHMKKISVAHYFLEKIPTLINSVNVPVSEFLAMPEEFDYLKKLKILVQVG